MTDKASVLKLFNNHLLEFIDDIINIFPDDLDLKTTKTFIEGLKKVNPRLVITIWRNNISSNYRKEIQRGDFTFFENKDYTQDFSGNKNQQRIISAIEKIRDDVKHCGKENKQKTVKYMQNLTKISDLYFL
tara:strand:- start:1224 stop:1616 length:393 start_codon:yes stop_codon:yes gene_type:complete